MRSGVVFFKTEKLQELVAFYTERIACEVWMDQGDCIILRFGSFLFAFCERTGAEREGVITFVYPGREDVDRMYHEHRGTALAPPRDNPGYPIYNFFARDPEGRLIEFQMFTNEPDWDVVTTTA